MTTDPDSPENASEPTPGRSGDLLDRRLLESLICPVTRAPLEYDRERGELISRRAGLAYPIRSGVPIMLEDAARKIED